MFDGSVKKAAAVTSSARLLLDGHAEFRTAFKLRINGEGQMRQGDKFKTPVVDAENLVAFEVQAGDVALDV